MWQGAQDASKVEDEELINRTGTSFRGFFTGIWDYNRDPKRDHNIGIVEIKIETIIILGLYKDDTVYLG